MGQVSHSTTDSYVPAGFIGGFYGIKGWVRIRSFTEPQENLLSYESLVLRDNQRFEPLKLDDGRVHGKGLIAHIAGVDDRETAGEFLGKEILLDIANLPRLREGEYYWHQLVGLKVWCTGEFDLTLLGRVDHLLDTGANDVLVISPCEGSVDLLERLIPYKVGDIVTKIDLLAGIIEVDWFLDG